jgi:hypothetical protein
LLFLLGGISCPHANLNHHGHRIPQAAVTTAIPTDRAAASTRAEQAIALDLPDRHRLGCSAAAAEWGAPGTMLLRNGCPMRDSTTEGLSDSMPYIRKQPIFFWSFPFLILLTGCDAKPECDSFETRNAVLKTVSDDHNNALIKYAVRNSTMAKSSDASAEAKNSKQQPLYALAEKIATTSTSENKRTLKCSGSMSVTIGETKASKEINFTVQQSPDGNISVSVDPFQF